MMAINNDINGINNDLLDKLISDIGSYNDDLLLMFNDIDDEFHGALKHIKCDVSRSLKESYEEISNNYKIINSNISSYVTDYANVKQAYLERGISIAKYLNSIEERK